MLSNFNAIIMLRVKTLETAELLTNQLPEVTISELTPLTAARDNSDPTSAIHFESNNSDNVATGKCRCYNRQTSFSSPKGRPTRFSMDRSSTNSDSH